MKRLLPFFISAVYALGLLPFRPVHTALAMVKTAEISAVTISVQAIGNVYVRSGPGKSHNIIAIMKKGQTLPSTVTDGDWTMLRINGQDGYVLTKYIKDPKLASGDTKIVKAMMSAGIYNGPSGYARQQAEAYEGDIYELLGEAADYYIILYNNKSAFVEKLKFQSLQKTFEGQSGDIGEHVFVPSAGRTYMEATNKTDVRFAPKETAIIMGTLYEGSIVPVLGQSGDWISIDYNNSMGYVKAASLKASSFKAEQTVKESIYEEAAQEFLIYMNEFRKEKGKKELAVSKTLMEAAQIRAKEIAQKYGHTRPDGTLFNSIAPNEIFGENIAHGSALPTALSAAKGFMSSEEHAGNVLDERNTKTGAACYNVNGDIYWVQLFG